jgi:SAM-dependent methyltransferase
VDARRAFWNAAEVTPAWFLDEIAHAGPEHLDPAFVSGYDRKQGHPDPEPDLRVLRTFGCLTPASTVVDLGAGTGRFALSAAAQCGRVVAVDISHAMAEHLRRSAADAGANNVECVVSGLLSYDHEGAPADAIYTRNALHQLPDFWKGIALHRMERILRPGGILRLHDLVYDFAPADAVEVLENWMRSASPDDAIGYTRDDFATHIRTEFSTYRYLLEPLLTAAGFEIVDSDVHMQVYATYTCIKP